MVGDGGAFAGLEPAGQGETGAKLLHHAWIAPAHELRLLAGRQAGQEAAGQFSPAVAGRGQTQAVACNRGEPGAKRGGGGVQGGRGRIAQGLRADLLRFRLIGGMPVTRGLWVGGDRVG